ncbi:MAG: gliding motility-associated ABC transporter permease subunit GldF [Bacteroidales bacterium]|nr:gliding motility-associated ABC transporter permease subunit GldF [Bacteroidales bacterium]
MTALFIKEINSFLTSIPGYIAMAVFLLTTSLFLWVFPNDFNILDFGYAQLDSLFIVAPYIFLFLIPSITMKSFAEENKNGTIELILTKPITDLKIIFAKYAASLVLFIISLLPTVIYYISVYQLGLPAGNIDAGGVIGSYVGLLLLGSVFIAIGLFASSISNNQIIAFLVSIVISGFLLIGFDFIYNFSIFGSFDLIIKSLGIMSHYTSISRGVLDLRDLLYFLSATAIFILLTKMSIESRKW